MAFTAKDVQTLRERTGVGMMDCKKALTEAAGDMEKAVDLLREKGLAAAAKKAGRIAAEGAVYCCYDEASSKAAIVEINSETDFAAKSEGFLSFLKAVGETAAKNSPPDVEALMALNLDGTETTVDAALKDKILTIGENLKIRRFEILDGLVSTYIHAGGRIGVVVQFEADKSLKNNVDFVELGKDIAMQIAALNPLYLDPGSVPADVLEHEKKIIAEQVKCDEKNQGKPDAVIEKIVLGRVGKYYKEAALLEQSYVKDGEKNVGQHIKDTAKAIGSPISVKKFVRYEKGEGLQKREENFAEEVAKQINK